MFGRVAVSRLELLTAAGLILFVACQSDVGPGPGGNHPPTATLAGGAPGLEGSLIAFDAGGSSDADGDSLVFAWTFGDGQIATGVAPTHAYGDDARYAVTVIVTDPAGASDTAAIEVHVANAPPVITAVTGPTQWVSGVSNTMVVAFTDPGTADTHTLTVAWGDGSGDTLTRGGSIAHTYMEPGSYVATVTVRDHDGAETSRNSPAVVVESTQANHPPTAQIGGPYTANEGTPFPVSATGSTDPDGDTLTYSWTVTGPGLISGSIDGPTPSLAYLDDGVFSVTVIATDRDGASDTATAPVTIHNVVPQILGVRSSAAQAVGTPAWLSLNVVDASVYITNDTLTATIDWGDGASSSANPASTIWHSYASAGVHRARIHVRDGDGGEASAEAFIGVFDPSAQTTVSGYRVIDLGSLGGGKTDPHDINDRGQIVGSSFTADGSSQAFLWEDGSMQGLGTLGGTGSVAQRISETEVIAGVTYPADGGSRPAVWRNGSGSNLRSTAGGDLGSRAVAITASGDVVWVNWNYLTVHSDLWRNGIMTDLGDLYAGPRRTYGAAINERGQIVGAGYNGEFWGPGDAYRERAWVWEDGTIRDLGFLGAYTCPDHPDKQCQLSKATDINEHGQIAGWSMDPTRAARAVLWDNGSMRDLGFRQDWIFNVVINDQGKVTGWGDSWSTYPLTGQAFYWNGGTVRILGSLGGGNTRVVAINESGIVAGTSRTASGEQHAFIWSEQGGMIDLGTGPHGFNAAWVVGINTRGDVVGSTAQCPSDNLETFCSGTNRTGVLWRRLTP